MSFHKFNPFTGSLKRATSLQPFYPISPLPLQKAEPVMIYDTINTKPVRITPAASYCTDKPPTLDPKLWAKYKLFQADMDKPVYLAGGKTDKILFGIAVAYVGLCSMQTVVFILKECLQVI